MAADSVTTGIQPRLSSSFCQVYYCHKNWPLGERYTAKFDGQFYPVEDDLGHHYGFRQIIGSSDGGTYEKRNGKIVSVSRLLVAPDGNSIHAVFENKESGGKTAFDFEKQK